MQNVEQSMNVSQHGGPGRSLKQVRGQGAGLNTPLSTQLSHSGFIHCSENCVSAAGPEVMPDSGLATQDAEDAPVTLTQAFPPLHCRYKSLL